MLWFIIYIYIVSVYIFLLIHFFLYHWYSHHNSYGNSASISAKDMRVEAPLKVRAFGQGSDAEIKNIDFRKQLEEREKMWDILVSICISDINLCIYVPT